MRPEVLARVHNLSGGFESQVVFRRVSFDIPRTGAVGLLGASGVGKSTLLRTLGRWNDLRPSFWVHGSVSFEGRDLLAEAAREEAQQKLALLQQKARLFTATVIDNAVAGVRGERPLSHAKKRDLAASVLEPWGLVTLLERRYDDPVTSLALAEQRMLALCRLVSAGARCILADEPLRDVADADRGQLLGFLARVKATIPVVFTSHNLMVSKKLADSVVLLADGTMVEHTKNFFEAPSTELGRRFVTTGSCWPRPEEQDPEWMHHQGRGDPDVPVASGLSKRIPSWMPTEAEKVRRPGGFHWISAGLLGGTQWPGLLQDEEQDLRGLASLGVRHLVNLTEKPFPQDKLNGLGILGTHFPIVDMSVPEMGDCLELCEQVSTWLQNGEPTVFHCRAGLGRTGTLLACMRILGGENAVSAIDTVRRVNNKYIQSEEQLRFLSLFACHVERTKTTRAVGFRRA